MQKYFQFNFPLSDSRMNPMTHFTDLTIFAHAEVGRLNQVIEVKIKKIVYFKKGEHIGVDITGLLQVIKPKLFQQIADATEQHALKEFELTDV